MIWRNGENEVNSCVRWHFAWWPTKLGGEGHGLTLWFGWYVDVYWHREGSWQNTQRRFFDANRDKPLPFWAALPERRSE